MVNKFEALPEEKRQRIMDAALDEFAAKGYEKGNTNEIVQKAGISKGLLFHYFGSKKKLYLYMVDHAARIVEAGIMGEIGMIPEDIVEMIAHITAVKMRMAIRYPKEYKVMVDAYFNTPDELKPDIGKEYASIAKEQKAKFVTMMDASRLREGVTPEQAYDLIAACAQGMFSPHLMKHERLSLEEAMEWLELYQKQMFDLLNLLKHGIYKDE